MSFLPGWQGAARSGTADPPPGGGGPVAVTFKSSGTNAAGASSVATGSFTPASGSLLVAFVGVGNDEEGTFDYANDITVATTGLTWTKRDAVPSHATAHGGWWRGCAIFTAPVVTGASMIATASLGGGRRCSQIAVYECTGQHASAPIGLTEVRNSYADQPTGAFSYSLGATSDADGAVIAGFVGEDYDSQTLSPGTSWTAGANNRLSNTFGADMQSQYFVGATSTAAWSVASSGYSWGWCAVAIEILPA